MPQKLLEGAKKAQEFYNEKAQIWNEKCALYARSYCATSCDDAFEIAKALLNKLGKDLKKEENIKKISISPIERVGNIISSFFKENALVIPEITTTKGIKYLNFNPLDQVVFDRMNFAQAESKISEIMRPLNNISDSGGLKSLKISNIEIVSVENKILESFDFTDGANQNYNMTKLEDIPNYSDAILELLLDRSIGENLFIHVVRL